MHPHHVLVTVTGFDRPGVASALFAALAAHDVEVLDVEQVVIRGRLVLGAALTLHGDPAALRRAATRAADALGVEVGLTLTPEIEDTSPPDQARHRVVVLGQPLRAGAVGLVARCIADLGGNIESMSRVAAQPVTGLELVVSGADHRLLCSTLSAAAAETGTDIAVERSERRRLPKRLLLVDVDSTLLRGDVFGMLAELAGQRDGSQRDGSAGLGSAGLGSAAGDPVDRDGAESLRARTALLAGLPESVFEAVRGQIWYDRGAPTLVAALSRMGFRCGAVSAAPAQVIEPLLDRMGLDLVAANRLEVVDGELTGRLVGGLVDRLGKARALLRFAEAYGVPQSQTVAAAAAGEVDLLALAGLGVTLQSAPAAPAAAAAGAAGAAGADPPGPSRYLDGLLLLLGMSRTDLDEPPSPPIKELSSLVDLRQRR
jgi:phosphoserine phosphatase